MAKTKQHGICKLTGQIGFYVDSHIIPLALTRLPSKGDKVVEAEIGSQPRLRFFGWYGNNLVIRAGEDILAKIDSNAITELRKHQLTWDSFSNENEHTFGDLVLNDGRPAFRNVALGKALELRLFFISLLWRAAASARPEFAEIALDQEIVRDLRSRLLANDPGDIADYPIQFFQVISKGMIHNRSPILERKAIIDETGSRFGEMDYVRFFLNGLVAHVHVANGESFPAAYESTFIGKFSNSIVFAHNFKDSRTHGDMQILAANQGHLPTEPQT